MDKTEELIQLMQTIADTQKTIQEQQPKTLKMIIISFTIVLSLLCGVLGYAINKAYDYDGYAPTNEIQNTNTTTIGGNE